MTSDYEGGLIRKLSEEMSRDQKDYMQLNNTIEEILLNAAFCSLNKVPQQQVKAIMSELLTTFSVYLSFEEKHPDLVEMMLQRSVFSYSNSNSVIEYLGGKATGTKK